MESLEILELQGNEIVGKIPNNFLDNSKVKDEQVWVSYVFWWKTRYLIPQHVLTMFRIIAFSTSLDQYGL